MLEGRGARNWISLLATAGVDVLIYHVGIVASFIFMLLARASVVQIPIYFAFLLVPLQITYVRRGPEAFTWTALLAFGLLLFLRLLLAGSALRELSAGVDRDLETVVLAPLPDVIGPMVAIEMVTVGALIGGLIWLNLYSRQHLPWRTTYRILAATGAATVVGLLTVVTLQGRSGFVESLTDLFANVLDMFRRALSETLEGQAPPPMEGVFSDPQALLGAFWDYVLAGFGFGYFVNVGAALYLGTSWGIGPGSGRSRPALRDFRLPENFVWPLIGSWALVLLNQYVPLGLLKTVAMNAGFICLFLFGMQGLGIIQHLMERNPRRRMQLNRIVIIALVAALFIPILTVAALVLVPLLGISEIWVNYRYPQKGDNNEGNP
jgi:hypothetical protein